MGQIIQFSTLATVFALVCWQASAQQIPSSVENIKVAKGAVPPRDLDNIVAEQNKEDQALSYIVQRIPKAPRPACSSSQGKFDWNALKKVTAIQNQGRCGDCWSFGAIAAYEASYLIENNLTASDAGTPGASEQEALDCSWTVYTCDGGWHDKVFDYFKHNGETTRPLYPYTAVKATCKGGAPVEQYAARRWNFVKGATIPSRKDLKQAICDHGSIVVAVRADHWDDATVDTGGNSVFVYSTANPNWARDFPNGVFRTSNTASEDASRSDLTMARLKPGDIDHDVLIVGWDDAI